MLSPLSQTYSLGLAGWGNGGDHIAPCPAPSRARRAAMCVSCSEADRCAMMHRTTAHPLYSAMSVSSLSPSPDMKSLIDFTPLGIRLEEQNSIPPWHIRSYIERGTVAAKCHLGHSDNILQQIPLQGSFGTGYWLLRLHRAADGWLNLSHELCFITVKNNVSVVDCLSAVCNSALSHDSCYSSLSKGLCFNFLAESPVRSTMGRVLSEGFSSHASRVWRVLIKERRSQSV